jgi:hypothetical protein
MLVGLPMTGGASTDCGEVAAWPRPFRLEFEATATRSLFAISGESDLALTRDGHDYRLVSETNAVGLYHARQTSRGTIGAAGLVPFEYSERRGRRPQVTTTLDWRARRVTFTATEDTAETRPQMQDRLSLLLELGLKLRRKPSARFIEMPVAGVRNTSIYRFELREREPIDVPAGRFDTVRLERPADQPGNDRHDRLEIWLAPALCDLPVRVRYADDRGMVIDQQLKAANLTP